MYDRFINWLTLKINKINPIIFVAVVFQIVFIIIIVITIINLTAPQDEATVETTDTPSNHLTITNINQQIPNLPVSGYEDITFSLYDTAWLNRNTSRELPDTLTANIREGSTTRQYFDDLDIHQANFIVDIPELNQSYQVNYLWSKDQYNTSIPVTYQTLVYCPTDSTSCRDRFAGTIDQILQSLPR